MIWFWQQSKAALLGSWPACVWASRDGLSTQDGSRALPIASVEGDCDTDWSDGEFVSGGRSSETGSG